MTQPKSNNLGQIAAIWISAYAPENQKLIWYDTNERIHKAYDTASGEWIAFNPQIVTNSTISQLRTIAQGSGLSVGKYYYLTDVGTLAIAITTTKVWYVDSHSNYVVNDLSASIQAYVNSDNLTIDGTTGVWNNSTGKLVFSFTRYLSGSSIQDSNDYVVMRRYNSSNSTWSWIKLRVKNIISSVSGNSITWNNGLYFNFASAINAIKNVAGGIVGYDQYEDDKNSMNQAIGNVAQGNDQILSEAKSYTDNKTTIAEIYGKQHSGAWTVLSNPPLTPNANATLDQILQILVSWANVLQNSDKINIGSGFKSDGRIGNVNYADNVRSAIEKLVYKVIHQAVADGISLPSGFNVNGRGGQFSASDALNVLLEKIIFQKQNRITFKDFDTNLSSSYITQFVAPFVIEPIPGEENKFIVNLNRFATDYFKLPSDFDKDDYTKSFPLAADTITTAIGKIAKYISDLTDDFEAFYRGKFYTYDGGSWTMFTDDDEYAQGIPTSRFRVKDGLLTIRLMNNSFSNANLRHGSVTRVVPLGFFPSAIASKFIASDYFVVSSFGIYNVNWQTGAAKYYYSILQVIKSFVVKQSNNTLVNIQVAILYEYAKNAQNNVELTGRILLGMYALGTDGSCVQLTDGDGYNTSFTLQDEVYSLNVNALFQ